MANYPPTLLWMMEIISPTLQIPKDCQVLKIAEPWLAIAILSYPHISECCLMCNKYNDNDFDILYHPWPLQPICKRRAQPSHRNHQCLFMYLYSITSRTLFVSVLTFKNQQKTQAMFLNSTTMQTLSVSKKFIEDESKMSPP